jgi:quinoprotein glucose dehydrogenase
MVPCNQPPWGTLIAVDLATGKIRWEAPLGVTPELASIPESAKWGSLNLGGSIVTAGGLIFISASRDNIFRAFDVETGRELWKMDLPAGGHATPMTYSASGRQFVVIAAGGHGRLNPRLGDYVIAYALE